MTTLDTIMRSMESGDAQFVVKNFGILKNGMPDTVKNAMLGERANVDV